MSTTTLPLNKDLQRLERLEIEAWNSYGAACWNPLASEQERHDVFMLAIRATQSVLDYERSSR